MRSPFRVLLLTVALVGGLLSPVAATAQSAGGVGSDNVTPVSQIEYAGAHNQAKNQGSDLEFVTLALDAAAQTRAEAQFGAPLVDADPVADGVQRTYSMAGAYDNGLQIIDVTDPENATLVNTYDCGVSQADVQIFQRDDEPGKTFVAFTHDTGYSAQRDSSCFLEAADLNFRARNTGGFGSFIIDVTNPYAPETVSWAEVPLGSHNQTVHPNGKFLYNSNSELITNAAEAAIEVISIENLAAPEQVATLPLLPIPGLGADSHDITFSEDGTRAYSAALSHTVIIDTTDPAAPVTISRIYDPMINVVHQANPVTLTDPVLGERTFLLIEDEVAGATPLVSCPTGGVHVWDITVEAAPVKVGFWNIADVAVGEPLIRCTAHVFQTFEEEGLMLIAFYNMGVRVVDISGLIGVALGGTGAGMQEIGFYIHDDADTWSVKAPTVDRDGVFHMYGNDQARGFDVYKVDLSGSGATEGTGNDAWMSPAEAAQAFAGSSIPAGYRPFCLIGDDPAPRATRALGAAGAL